MRGINPFTPGIQKPEELVGRKEEVNLFNSYLSSTLAGQPVFMLVIGTKGIGKTSLLRYYQAIAEKNKALAVLFRSHKSDDLQRLIDELENTINEKISLGALTKKYTESLKNVKINDNNCEKTMEGIYTDMKKDLSAIVFLIDDAHNLSKESLRRLISLFTKLADKKIHYMLVLSSSGELHLHEYKELFRPIYVSELNQKDITELIEKSLAHSKIKVGEECLHTIIDDSQGHPLVLLTICWTIYDKIKENERIISRGHYIAYLPTIMSNLSRELFDDLYEETSSGEREVLGAFANGEATVSDVAVQLNKPLNTVTTLVLRLAESGNLRKIARGRYKIFNRLYGKYVLGRGQ